MACWSPGVPRHGRNKSRTDLGDPCLAHLVQYTNRPAGGTNPRIWAIQRRCPLALSSILEKSKGNRPHTDLTSDGLPVQRRQTEHCQFLPVQVHECASLGYVPWAAWALSLSKLPYNSKLLGHPSKILAQPLRTWTAKSSSCWNPLTTASGP